MRILSKEEVIYWTNKFDDGRSLEKNSIIHDPKKNLIFAFNFKFSINERSVSNFETLLSNFLKEGISVEFNAFDLTRPTLTSSSWSPSTPDWARYRDSIIFDYDVLSKFKNIETKSEFFLRKVKYIKYEYIFKDVSALVSCLYMQLVFDAIKILNDFYDIDENGREISKVQYSIGSIVSLKNDNRDYMIDSYKYIRENTIEFKEIKFKDEYVLYKLINIESIDGQAIIFGDRTLHRTTHDILPNRNDRLDQLLEL